MLANPSQEYLILQPSENADPFTVTLEADSDSAEWFRVNGRETVDAGKVTVKSGGIHL